LSARYETIALRFTISSRTGIEIWAIALLYASPLPGRAWKKLIIQASSRERLPHCDRIGQLVALQNHLWVLPSGQSPLYC